MKHIGKISYGIYFYHLPLYVCIDTYLRPYIAHLLGNLLPNIPLGLQAYGVASISLVIKLTLLLGIAMVSYQYFEKRFLVYGAAKT